MSEPTERDELDYKGLLLTRKFNPFFWRNLYEETGGDEYWMHKDEKGRYTKGNGARFIPDDHPVLKEFADMKQKLGLEGEGEIRKIFLGKKNLRRLGYDAVEGDTKDRFAQVFLDYDNPSHKSKKEKQKPREQRMISSYLRQRYFNLGLEDPKYSSFDEKTGKVEVPASKALKEYLDKRKELSEKLDKLGFDVSEEKEEEVYSDDIKELEDLQKQQEELLTGTETPASAPAGAGEGAGAGGGAGTGKLRGMEEGNLQTILQRVTSKMGNIGVITAEKRNDIIEEMFRIINGTPFKNKEELQNLLGSQKSNPKFIELTGNVPKKVKAIEETNPEPVTPAQPSKPAIDPSNTNADGAAQLPAPSDTEPAPAPAPTPAEPAEPAEEEQKEEENPAQPPPPDELQTPREPQEVENIDNKNPSVRMDISKDRINIGEKVDDIPNETILDKIPESRFSSQFKTIKQLNDDIKYLIKNYENDIGKELIKQENEAVKNNLE